jgi:membrane associated rhomboid family serine protease
MLSGRGGRGAGALWLVALIWVVGNIVFGFVPVLETEGEIAWVAHLGGFFAGLALFGLFQRRASPA